MNRGARHVCHLPGMYSVTSDSARVHSRLIVETAIREGKRPSHCVDNEKQLLPHNHCLEHLLSCMIQKPYHVHKVMARVEALKSNMAICSHFLDTLTSPCDCCSSALVSMMG
jgi:hypothetical protein